MPQSFDQFVAVRCQLLGGRSRSSMMPAIDLRRRTLCRRVWPWAIVLEWPWIWPWFWVACCGTQPVAVRCQRYGVPAAYASNLDDICCRNQPKIQDWLFKWTLIPRFKQILEVISLSQRSAEASSFPQLQELLTHLEETTFCRRESVKKKNLEARTRQGLTTWQNEKA